MTKQEQALRQNLADLKAAAEGLMGEGKQTEAKAKIEEAKAAKIALDNFLEVQNLSVSEPLAQTSAGIQKMKDHNEDIKSYKEVFFKALRGKSLNEAEASVMDEFKAALSESTGASGGFIVPEDIQTAINELKQTVDSLEQYVTVEPVKTNKGQRTLEPRADSTPFAPLSEYATPNAMGEIASPTFNRISYAIEDYAGFLPVPNDLLSDTDQALEAYLRRWIAKKSKATRNSLIIAQLNTLTKVAFADYQAIKKALNVTLDPAISNTATIFTNQDGFNFLDQIKVTDGRPLLQPDPTNTTQHRLFGRTVVILSNKTIPTLANKVPFIVGDLKEAIVLFDRQQMSLDMTTEGGSAWRSNTTEFRAIERENVKVWDSAAVVYGQLDITTV